MAELSQAERQAAYQRLVQQVAASPGDAGSWFRLGVMLHEIRRWGAASGCMARSAELSPGNVRALAGWGWNLHLIGRHGEALDKLREAWGLAPQEGLIATQLSQVLLTVGEKAEALELALRGRQLQPEASVNGVALAFAFFENGRWLEGWREYRARFDYRLQDLKTRPFPLWEGQRVNRLFVEAEQGLGDSLFGFRWVRPASELCGQIMLYCQKELLGLFRANVPENVECLPLPQPLPLADAYCPLMSLPAALGDNGTGDGLPYLRNFPYNECGLGKSSSPLVARVEINGTWQPLNVGIAWAGNAVHESSHNRDAHLAYFLRLAEVPRVRLHSLQVGDRAGDLNELGCAGLVVDRSGEITNFSDTARIVAGLDLVVSVDTAVAHLAGAMGCPVWMLVNRRGMDFRWLDRADDRTGWYGSMRLFRRGLDEDWATVMERVAVALREAVDG